MMGYKDMTFCEFFPLCKKGNTCDRALTDYVVRMARKWWGSKGEPPIAVYVDKPDCYESQSNLPLKEKMNVI